MRPRGAPRPPSDVLTQPLHPSAVAVAVNDEGRGYFANLGINTVGFFEWKHRGAFDRSRLLVFDSHNWI